MSNTVCAFAPYPLPDDNVLTTTPGIGQLTERSLHAALKDYLAQPGDRFEVKLGRYVIDIVRGDLLIEIQTRHLYALRPKLLRLLSDHPVRLIHPLPAERWIVREGRDGRQTRRKSPKRATACDIFTELVRVPDLVAHPDLTLEVLLIREEQQWRDDGQGSWRRGRWSLVDTRLLGVVESAVFGPPADFLALLPPLPEPFTNADLAHVRGWNSHLAGKATYALRAMGLLATVGKRDRANLFLKVHSPMNKVRDQELMGIAPQVDV